MSTAIDLSRYTPEQLEAFWELHKRRLRDDLNYFAEWTVKRFVDPGVDPTPALHHRLLLNKLQAVADGKIRKLMIWMPPGSAKSTYASKIFPAWLMARRPTKVIGASNNLRLALEFSGEVQSLLADEGELLGVSLANENKEWWKLTNGSAYVAAGVGSGIQGIRADLAMIDDPVRSSEEVLSESNRDKTYQWFKTDLYGRLKPGAAVIVIQTRWHIDDLSGRILELQAEGWEVICLPAVWDQDEQEPAFPDGLGRQRGELLWPGYHGDDFIADKKATHGPKDFAALYQQDPRPSDASLFQIGLIKKLDLMNGVALPGAKKLVRAWDIAATEKHGSSKPDWTVGVLMQRNVNDTYTILDVVRFQGGPETVREMIHRTAVSDAETYGRVHVSIAQDPGAAGKIVAHDFIKMLAGFSVSASVESGSKVTRAGALAAQVNAGHVTMVKAPWNAALLDEMEIFPGGRHDDQVDAASRAFGALLDLPPLTRRPTFGRHNLFSR